MWQNRCTSSQPHSNPNRQLSDCRQIFNPVSSSGELQSSVYMIWLLYPGQIYVVLYMTTYSGHADASLKTTYCSGFSLSFTIESQRYTCEPSRNGGTFRSLQDSGKRQLYVDQTAMVLGSRANYLNTMSLFSMLIFNIPCFVFDKDLQCFDL